MSLIKPAVSVLLACAGVYLIGVSLWAVWVAYLFAGIFDMRRLSDLNVSSALEVASIFGVGALLMALAARISGAWRARVKRQDDWPP